MLIRMPPRVGRGLERPPAPFGLNRRSPFADGLVAWFPLSAPGDSRCRISGDQLTGADYLLSTSTGTDFITPQQPIVRWGMSYDTGSPAVLGSNIPRYAAVGAMSAMAWVRVATTGQEAAILGKLDAGFNGWALFCFFGAFYAFLGGFNAGGVFSPAAGELCRLGMTWDGATLRAYVNGRASGSGQAVTVPGAPNVPLELGNYNNTAGSAFRGVITDCRVYKRALSPMEMWMDYESSTRWDICAVPTLRTYFDVGAGGATEFDENYDGTITPAGALQQQVAKFFSGSVAPAGALLKRDDKSLSGSITSSGALNRQAQASYSGSTTPAGAIAKSVGKGTQGLLTPSGDPNLDMGKFLAGSSTPAGSLAKQSAKPFAGSIASSGALSIIRAILRLFEGTITPAGTLAFSIGKSLTGLVTPAGALFKAISRTLSGSSTPAGALRKQTGKAVSGTITPAGDVSTFRIVILALAGTIAPVGALVKFIGKRFAGLIASLGSLLIEGGTPQAPPLFGGTIHIQPEPHTIEIMESRTVHIPEKGYES